MAIQKAANVKLVIQPVIGIMVHEYVFEGPCRFGEGDTLTLEFDRDISGKRVLMQDIFSDSAEDVTAGVQRVSGRLVIPGELIDRICDRHAPGDTSAPGIAIKLAD